MTVKELKEILNEYPEDVLVGAVSGYTGEYLPIHDVFISDGTINKILVINIENDYD